MVMQMLEQIPDSAKVGVSLSAPALTLMGVTLEDWSYILAMTVSVVFIIEKIHKWWMWYSRKREKRCTQRIDGS